MKLNKNVCCDTSVVRTQLTRILRLLAYDAVYFRGYVAYFFFYKTAAFTFKIISFTLQKGRTFVQNLGTYLPNHMAS